jgi:hypothetical protein
MKISPPPGVEPYNGYRKHNSAIIPISLGSVKEISWRDKWIQRSEDTIERAIKRLQAAGLIFKTRLQCGLRITFVKSPLLSASLQKSGRQDKAESRDQMPQTCGPDPANLRHAYKEYLGDSLGLRQEKGEQYSDRFDRRPARSCPPPEHERRAPELAVEMTDDMKLVTNTLEEFGIKISSPSDVPGLIELTLKYGVSAAGLAKFIAVKAKRTHIETARFFWKVIPADLPAWAKRNADELYRLDHRRHERCKICDDTGFVGGQRYGRDDSGQPAPFCGCFSGDKAREMVMPVYTVAESGCESCLSTLRMQAKTDADQENQPVCAFCPGKGGHWLSGRSLEDPAVVAARRGAAVAALPCRDCCNEGIVKTNWTTVGAAARFCDCRWGNAAVKKHGPDYPASLAAQERQFREDCRHSPAAQFASSFPSPKASR